MDTRCREQETAGGGVKSSEAGSFEDGRKSKLTPGCRCHGQKPVMKPRPRHVGSRHAGSLADKRAIDDVLAPSPGSKWGFRGGTRFMAGSQSCE